MVEIAPPAPVTQPAPRLPPPVSQPAALPPPSSRPERAPSERFPAPNEAPREPELRDNVIGFYSGLQIGLSPGIGFDPNTGKVAFNIGLGVGYGIDTGPVVFIPSIHAAGFFGSGYTVLTGMPSAGIVLPVGPVGVRIEGGLGPGYETQSSTSALAYRAMAAVSVHPTPRSAFGLGLEYTHITKLNFSVIGPILILSF